MTAFLALAAWAVAGALMARRLRPTVAATASSYQPTPGRAAIVVLMSGLALIALGPLSWLALWGIRLAVALRDK